MREVLRVLPNPWAAIDRDGDPCAIVPRDPDDGGGPLQFVGARLDRSRTKVLQDFGRSKRFGDHSRHEIRSAKQSTKYSYLGIDSSTWNLAAQLAAKDAIELPSTKYYRARLREGSLIPMDQATAKRVGVPFTPLKELFEHLGRLHNRPEPEPEAAPAEATAEEAPAETPEASTETAPSAEATAGGSRKRNRTHSNDEA